MTEKTQQQKLENQLRQIERRMTEQYLEKKRPVRIILKFISSLTEGQRDKFFRIFPNGINEKNLKQAAALVERTILAQKNATFE